MNHRLDPERRQNWSLACELCGRRFRDDERAQAFEDHARQFHGQEPGQSVALRLEWIGLGPAPKARPSWLT